MSERIKLSRDKAIVFMGSMNAMPMMYALELRNLGYEVIYFVDVRKSETLCRPEHHFPEIDYPYPSWIVEFILPSQLLLPLFPKFFAALYQRRIERATKNAVGCFVLNGFFSSLVPYLPASSHRIALSHGSDLDVWANAEGAEILANNFKNRSIFKYLPAPFSKRLTKYVIDKQFSGFARSDAVVYFPLGFSAAGDKVLTKLMNLGVRCIPRYDASFRQLQGQSREFRMPSERLEIFSCVRFLFRTFPDGDKGAYKGNDLILEGIARYLSGNRHIRVHFVEKGEDVQCAKKLCREFGLEEVVVWHKEMPFKDLLALFRNSDVCLDQVGRHWIGAGMYALWFGKPLIANPESAVRSGVWPINNPICAARTSQEVYEWLLKLESVELRRELARQSKDFVERYITPMKALNCMFEY